MMKEARLPPTLNGSAGTPHEVGRRLRLTSMLVATVLASACASTPSTKALSGYQLPVNEPTFKRRVYAGASLGNAMLDVDTRGTAFNVGDDSGSSTQLRLGVDVHNLLAVELDTAILGTATLRQSNMTVDYSAVTLSGLVYASKSSAARSRREKLSGYARLGLSSLGRASQIEPLNQSEMALVVGVGAEYGLASGLALRTELTRFDSDALVLGLGAVFRFGLTPSQAGGAIARAMEPVRAQDRKTAMAKDRGATVTPRESASNVKHVSFQEQARQLGPRLWTPAITSDDSDRDGIADVSDACAGSPVGVTVDSAGCGLFDRQLDRVSFKSGSAWLDGQARSELDKVAVELLAFPEARVQVRAHTDNVGTAEVNKRMSLGRAQAVVDYLTKRGVSSVQLNAYGAGAESPLVSNDTEEGRQRNRRVDLVTLADLQTAAVFGFDDAPTELAMVQLGGEPSNVVKPTSAPIITPVSKPAPVVVESEDMTEAPVLAAAKPVDAQPGPPLASAKPGVDLLLEPTALTPAMSVMTPLPQALFVPGLELEGVVKGVVFEPGASVLAGESQSALDKVVAQLKGHPAVHVAVMAHTDDQGPDDMNLTLSEKRAKAVVAYLIDQGITAKRLRAEGYGESLPLVQNVTDSDRARNRRIELRFIDPNE